MLDTQWAGMALVLTAGVLWSSSGLFVKILTLHGFALIGIRGTLAFLALLPFSNPRRMRLDRNLLLLTVAFCATQICFVFATRWTTAANAIALQSAAPAWVFLIGCARTRRVEPPLLIPIAMIVAGIVVILAEPVQGASFHGNLLAFGAGFAFAITLISFKRVNQPAIGAVALANLGTAIACFLVQPSVFQLSLIPAWEWASLVFLGAIQIGLGMVCFTHGVQRISVGQASVLTLVEPLLNPVWVFLLIGELPSGFGFAGFALILAGILTDLWLRFTFPRLRISESGPEAGLEAKPKGEPEPQQESMRVE